MNLPIIHSYCFQRLFCHQIFTSAFMMEKKWNHDGYCCWNPAGQTRAEVVVPAVHPLTTRGWLQWVSGSVLRPLQPVLGWSGRTDQRINQLARIQRFSRWFSHEERRGEDPNGVGAIHHDTGWMASRVHGEQEPKWLKHETGNDESMSQEQELLNRIMVTIIYTFLDLYKFTWDINFPHEQLSWMWKLTGD